MSYQFKGINGGKYFANQSKATIVDIMDAQERLLVKQTDEQIPAIPNLKHDYSVMIDENGTQLKTVGNHWKLSQALDNETKAKFDRNGACLSCHKETPKEDLAVLLMLHTANFTGFTVDNTVHQSIVNKSILISSGHRSWEGFFGRRVCLSLYEAQNRK